MNTKISYALIIATSAFILMNSQSVFAVGATSTYVDAPYGIKLNYGGLGMQTRVVSSYIPPQNNFPSGSSKDLLTLYLKPSLYKGTNLEAAWFNFAVDKISQTDCYAYTHSANKSYSLNQTRKVQGNLWHYNDKTLAGGAALGHGLRQEIYRLYKSDTCYEITLGATDFSRGFLDSPSSVKDYNIKTVFHYLGAVFNRLQIQRVSTSLKSGIIGTVIGHYCNGAQPANPPTDYQPCGEEPLPSLSLKIKNIISGEERQVITDRAGKFKIMLTPGKYAVTQATRRQAIIGGSTSVEVKSGRFTKIQLKIEELRP